MIDSLYIHGYFIVKNFFDKQQTNYFISQVFESIKKKETHLSSSDENEVVHPKTWNVNAHPIWENTLYSILGNVEELVDEKLIPIYSYQRTYLKDAEMSHHTDWPWCQISLTVNIGQSHSYPLFVTDMQTKKSIEIIQEPGDAVFYLGHNISHYRNKFEGDWYSQLFLHYVIDNATMKQYERFFIDDVMDDISKNYKKLLYPKEVTKLKNIKYDMLVSEKDNIIPCDRSMYKTTNKPKIKLKDLETDVHMLGGQYSAKPMEHFMDSVHQTRGAIPPDICKELIDLYEDYASREEISSGLVHSGLDKDVKNTGELDLLKIEEGSRYVSVLEEISDHCIFNYMTKFGMAQHYDPSEIDLTGHYYPMWEIHKYDKGVGHYESWHTEGSHLYEYGNRVFTSMFYLNDVEEGGRTVFPYARSSIKCEEGKHFAFPTTFPYVHYGQTPESNDKYILTTWWQAKWPDEYLNQFVQLKKPAPKNVDNKITFEFEEIE
tara:strand:- start:1403 stop:2869 length:1467 start_codon:yes stop_codon:yes gene_type:complete